MVVAGALLCAIHALAAAPVYGGVASRDAALEAQAERVAIALGQALDRRGVVDLGSPPLPDAVDGNDAILDGLVAAARSKTLEGDFATAVQKAEEAINRFEGSGAFRSGPAWNGYADALVVRAVSLRRLGKDVEADASLGKLAAILPKVVPDPGITPPKVLQRHQQLLDELRSKPRVDIEVQSDPPGADVVVDGQAHGKTPIVVRDLLPGAHFVALSAEGERVERKLVVTTGTGRVSERIGDPRSAAVRVLRTRLAVASSASDIADAARNVGDDVIVGALLADKDGAMVVLARAKDGALVVVAGARLDKKTQVSARASELVDALLDGKAAWLGEPGPATPELVLTRGVPAEALLAGALGPDVPPPAGDAVGEDAPWALIAVGAGVAVVALSGAVVGVLLATANANKVEVTVDASKLK